MSESSPPASHGASGGPGGCTPAPQWLVDAISEGILVRGAYMSNAYVGPASGFTSGPAEVLSVSFAEAWWVAGRLTGAGVQPELAVWVTNRTTAQASGEIFAVNPAATRYTEWSAGVDEPITGEGLQAVQACVGPMPTT